MRGSPGRRRRMRVSVRVWALGLAALLALTALAACNGAKSDDGDSTATAAAEASPTEVAAASPAPEECPVVEDEVVEGIFVLLELETKEVAAGDPVVMTMRQLNCASREIRRHFQTEQRYDFWVAETGGDEVWRWSSGQEFAEEEGEETYAPAEEVAFEETWEQTDNAGAPVEPGSYEIGAESTGCDEPLATCGPSTVAIIEIVP
jgi:hypothetical protein